MPDSCFILDHSRANLISLSFPHGCYKMKEHELLQQQPCVKSFSYRLLIELMLGLTFWISTKTKTLIQKVCDGYMRHFSSKNGAMVTPSLSLTFHELSASQKEMNSALTLLKVSTVAPPCRLINFFFLCG